MSHWVLFDSSRPISDFIASWPILGIPEAILFYAVFKILRFTDSFWLRYFAIALPGIFWTMICSIGPGDTELDWFIELIFELIFSFVLFPTGLVMPIVAAYSLSRIFKIKSNPPVETPGGPRQKIVVLALLLLYVWNQIVVIILASVGD